MLAELLVAWALTDHKKKPKHHSHGSHSSHSRGQTVDEWKADFKKQLKEKEKYQKDWSKGL